jgi:methyl coenzyme M reductase beta subunit
MTSPRVYASTSIDLFAFLAAIGYIVAVIAKPGETRATFEVTQTPNLFTDIAAYEANAPAPAKRLLNARSRLFRQASDAVKGAHHG